MASEVHGSDSRRGAGLRKLAARVEHLEGLIALKRQQLALLKQMAES